MSLPGAALWGAAVAVLAVVCVAFTYPLVAYSHNVLYRRGVLLFVAALVCFTGGAVFELLVDLRLVAGPFRVVAYVAYAASSLVAVAAMWRFAREFVDFEGDDGVDLDAHTDDYVGGFEDE